MPVDGHSFRRQLNTRMIRLINAKKASRAKLGNIDFENREHQDRAFKIEALTHHQGWNIIEQWLIERADPFKAIDGTPGSFEVDEKRLVYAKCANDLLDYIYYMIDLANQVREMEKAKENAEG